MSLESTRNCIGDPSPASQGKRSATRTSAWAVERQKVQRRVRRADLGDVDILLDQGDDDRHYGDGTSGIPPPPVLRITGNSPESITETPHP